MERFLFWSITLLCWLGAGWGLWKLLQAFQGGSEGGQGPPLGVLTQSTGPVKRKPAFRFAWQTTGPSEAFYLKDSLQTGTGGSAHLELEDGSLLDIGEKSLVVIDQNTDLPLAFVRGSVTLQNPRKKIPPRKIVGSALQPGKIEVRPLTVLLQAPAAQASVVLKADLPEVFSFTWAFTQDPGAQALEERVLVVQANQQAPRFYPLEPGQTQKAVELVPGQYRWWLKNAHQNPWSEVRSLWIEAPPPPPPVAPTLQAPPEGFLFTLIDPTTPLTLRWQEVPGWTSPYRVTVWRETEKDKWVLVHHEALSQKTEWTLSDWEEGRYRWTVAAQIAAPDQFFQVQRPSLLTAPQLKPIRFSPPGRGNAP